TNAWPTSHGGAGSVRRPREPRPARSPDGAGSYNAPLPFVPRSGETAGEIGAERILPARRRHHNRTGRSSPTALHQRREGAHASAGWARKSAMTRAEARFLVPSPHRGLTDGGFSRRGPVS